MGPRISAAGPWLPRLLPDHLQDAGVAHVLRDPDHGRGIALGLLRREDVALKARDLFLAEPGQVASLDADAHEIEVIDTTGITNWLPMSIINEIAHPARKEE